MRRQPLWIHTFQFTWKWSKGNMCQVYYIHKHNDIRYLHIAMTFKNQYHMKYMYHEQTSYQNSFVTKSTSWIHQPLLHPRDARLRYHTPNQLQPSPTCTTPRASNENWKVGERKVGKLEWIILRISWWPKWRDDSQIFWRFLTSLFVLELVWLVWSFEINHAKSSQRFICTVT